MEKIEVKPVGAKAAQAAGAGGNHAPGSGVFRQNLAHQERLVASARDCFGHEFFGAAVAVHFGGVNEGGARSSPSRSALPSVCFAGFSPMPPSSQAESRAARPMAVRPSSCDAAPPLVVSWTRPAGHCRKGFYSPWPGLCIGSGLAFVPAVQWPGQAAQQARAGGGREMLERIDHVNLVVADMPRMVAFYKDVLGMRLAKQAVISGPWIEAVTGLSPVEAEVAFLEASSGPRIELIRYRPGRLSPRGRRPPQHARFSAYRFPGDGHRRTGRRHGGGRDQNAQPGAAGSGGAGRLCGSEETPGDCPIRRATCRSCAIFNKASQPSP